MCQLEFISAASKVLFLTLNLELAFGKSNWGNATVPHTTTFVTGNNWKPRVEFLSKFIKIVFVVTPKNKSYNEKLKKKKYHNKYTYGIRATVVRYFTNTEYRIRMNNKDKHEYTMTNTMVDTRYIFCLM